MSLSYERLSAFLLSQSEPTVTLSFGEVEKILGFDLPQSARKYPVWWQDSGKSHSRGWVHAEFKIGGVDFSAETVQFEKATLAARAEVAAPSVHRAGPFGRRSAWAHKEHLVALDAGFDRYLGVFGSRKIFSGPSVYFYERSIQLVREAKSMRALATSESYLECVYATLVSWGMHRMGETTKAKLTDFAVFKRTMALMLADLADLSHVSILDLGDDDAPALTARLAEVVSRRGITASESPLVANTKAMHFMLPDLVPPMDRTYTGRFFYGPSTGMTLPGSPADLFTSMFDSMRWLGQRHAEAIRCATATPYMSQGHAKILDNAIVGYVLTHVPPKKKSPAL